MIVQKQILNYREEINEIDAKTLALLEKRFVVCKKIGAYKKKNGLAIEDLEREKQVIKNRINKNSLSSNFITKLFQLIFEESKGLQNES